MDAGKGGGVHSFHRCLSLGISRAACLHWVADRHQGRRLRTALLARCLLAPIHSFPVCLPARRQCACLQHCLAPRTF